MRAASVARLLVLAAFTAAPAWAQTTNQLFLTGTGSGSEPSIQATGVDTNIGISLLPKGTGGIGIGIAAPVGTILDVAPSGGGSYLFRDSAGTAGTIKMGNSGGGNYIESGVTTTSGSAAPLYFSDMNASNIWLTITSTGSVGIGTAAPATSLDVNGDVRDRNATSCAMLGTDVNGKLICNTPALVLISTQTASSSATLQWTGLGSTYNTYFLDCNAIIPATNAVDFDFQVGEGATPTWETAGNYYGSLVWTDNGNTTVTGLDTANAASLPLTALTSIGTSNAGYNLSLKLWYSNVASTTVTKQIVFSTTYDNTGSQSVSAQGGGGYFADTNAITGIRVKMSSGNISSGQCSLYGMNH